MKLHYDGGPGTAIWLVVNDSFAFSCCLLSLSMTSTTLTTRSRPYISHIPAAHLPRWNLSFLTLKSRQLLLDISPNLRAINQALDSSADSILVGTDLLGRVSVSQSIRLVVDRLEVNRDTQRCTEFIVTTVSLADGCRRVIDSA